MSSPLTCCIPAVLRQNLRVHAASCWRSHVAYGRNLRQQHSSVAAVQLSSQHTVLRYQTECVFGNAGAIGRTILPCREEHPAGGAMLTWQLTT